MACRTTKTGMLARLRATDATSGAFLPPDAAETKAGSAKGFRTPAGHGRDEMLGGKPQNPFHKETCNLRTVQLLFGNKMMDTVGYLGIKVDEPSAQVELWLAKAGLRSCDSRGHSRRVEPSRIAICS